MDSHKIGGKWLDDLNAELSGSDRACSVLAGAILDDLLVRLLKAFLLPPNNDHDDKLLGRARPLDSFAARTELARRLNLIEVSAAKSLDHVRDIRNLAAHKQDFSFVQDVVISKVSNIIAQLQLSDSVKGMRRAPYTGAKGEFVLSVVFLVAHLEIEIAEMAHSRHVPTSSISKFLVGDREG